MTGIKHHHARGLGLTSPASRQRMIEELRASGIEDPRVLAAMTKIPRHEFVEQALQSEAYRNRPLPIGHAQTISQPSIVAFMTQALLQGGRRGRVLEIGTGSGYQTAVLAEIVETVFTVERLRALSEVARQRLHAMGYRNVHFGYSDGMQGWSPYAPYESILVTAGAAEVPQPLVDQLAMGGRLIIPIGPQGNQSLMRYERTAQGLQQELLAQVSFVPLLSGKS